MSGCTINSGIAAWSREISSTILNVVVSCLKSLILKAIKKNLLYRPHSFKWQDIRSLGDEQARSIWVRSRNCGCLVNWFCYQLIAKPGNKTATVSWPDPYTYGTVTRRERSVSDMLTWMKYYINKSFFTLFLHPSYFCLQCEVFHFVIGLNYWNICACCISLLSDIISV